MHRSNRLAKKRLWGALLSLVVGVAPAWAQGQPPAPAAAAKAPALQPGTIVLPLKDALVLPVNVGQRVQMSGRQRIAAASNNRDNVVELRGVANDPTTDIVIAKEPGAARITLTDEQGRTEALDILVTAADIEYIRASLNKTVPTAAVAPLPAGGSLVLTGTIEKAEDADVLLRITKAMAPAVDVINHLRVGGVQQVQLDVTVARGARPEFLAL